MARTNTLGIAVAFCSLANPLAALHAVAKEGASGPITGYGILSISIQGLKNLDGNAHIAVFDSPDTWLKTSVASTVLTLSDAKCEQNTCVWHTQPLAYGEYGIAIYHDANDNQELDSNFIGIPVEDYGFSNNRRATFGPPKWKKAKFSLAEPQLVHQITVD